MEELKPCPFCGGVKIESYQVTPGWTDPYWTIGCPDCGAWFQVSGWTEKDAQDAWNSRAGEDADRLAIEAAAMKAERDRAFERLCDWCGVCQKGRRNPVGCEIAMIGEEKNHE